MPRSEKSTAKKKKPSRNFKPKPKPKAPAVALGPKALAEVARIRQRLAEMREYKAILERDGLEPDAEDKVRESALIVQLLRLEKGLPPKAAPKAKAKKKRPSAAKGNQRKQR